MSIRDRMDAPTAEAWRPAEPKEFPGHPNPLVGTVVEVDEGDGDYGPYPILYIREENGNEWRWHVYGGVAQNRIIKLKPVVGDEIGVRYLGEEDSKNYKGKKYKNWKIVLNKPEGSTAGPNWDAMKPEEDVDEGDDF